MYFIHISVQNKGQFYCIYWVVDFSFLLCFYGIYHLSMKRLQQNLHLVYRHTHTRTQTLRQLTICVDFFNGSNTYVFSRSDGLKWSYFRTFVFLIRAWTLPQREIHAAITRDIYLKFSWNSTAILCTHDTRQSPLIYLCMTGVSF